MDAEKERQKKNKSFLFFIFFVLGVTTYKAKEILRMKDAGLSLPKERRIELLHL